jgi:hypothetical protein
MNSWTPVKTIFDFDRRVPAGTYTMDLSAEELYLAYVGESIAICRGKVFHEMRSRKKRSGQTFSGTRACWHWIFVFGRLFKRLLAMVTGPRLVM